MVKLLRHGGEIAIMNADRSSLWAIGIIFVKTGDICSASTLTKRKKVGTKEIVEAVV